ncbi:MAG TPA: flagellar biosynthetic protein FliR [Polyangiaceae bacterium]|nr:flagellar biosynthetic protein FliR [Polyangiaceae bacterium]
MISIADVTRELAGAGVDVRRLALAWARVMPSVVLVPAFGLRALPGAGRAVMALAFAAGIVPAVGSSAQPIDGAFPVLVVAEAMRGLPVALAAAVPLWAATMAGGVADALRGAQNAPPMATVEGPATPLGVALSLLASAMFLSTGGPARVVRALALTPASGDPLGRAASDIVGGITLAVALGGPLLAAAVVIETAAALIARAASPAQIHALLAPVRALGAVAVLAIVLDRLAGVLARAVQAAPPP